MLGGAGLSCPPGDPARLADAAVRLYEASQAERDRMGRTSRRYFEREFDDDLLVSRLEGWFHEFERRG